MLNNYFVRYSINKTFFCIYSYSLFLFLCAVNFFLTDQNVSISNLIVCQFIIGTITATINNKKKKNCEIIFHKNVIMVFQRLVYYLTYLTINTKQKIDLKCILQYFSKPGKLNT